MNKLDADIKTVIPARKCLPLNLKTSSDIVSNKWLNLTKKGKGAKYCILHSGTLHPLPPKKPSEREREYVHQEGTAAKPMEKVLMTLILFTFFM